MQHSDIIARLSTKNLKLEDRVKDLRGQIEILEAENQRYREYLVSIARVIDYSGHYGNLDDEVRSRISDRV